MFERFTRVFWGDFNSTDELKKIFGLALAAFFLIGAQWPVKILKDTLLVGFLGAKHQPSIKMFSIFLCFPITILYTISVEHFRREKIIYFIASIYALLGVGLAGLLTAWSIGIVTNINLLSNTFYLFSETLTAITIPSFWAFVNDVTQPEEAKRSYPVIVFFAQLGGLVFTLFAKYIPLMVGYGFNLDSGQAFAVSTPFVTLTSSILLVLFVVAIWEIVHVVKKRALQGYQAANDQAVKSEKSSLDKFSIASFINGLILIISRPYVYGVFLLTAFQEISGSLMQYSLLTATGQNFLSKAAICDFMFNYGLVIQVVAVVFSLIGTSWFQRNIGVRGCLLGYPAFLMGIFVVVLYWPNVYVIAMCTALAKGLNYALNKPVREILYIPTSIDIKYRSKAWIEVFGSRAAKATGASITKFSQKVPGVLGLAFTILPLVWLATAKLVGDKYHTSVQNKEKIS